MAIRTREQLEDAVYDAYPTLDMDTIESLPDSELRYLLDKNKPGAVKPNKVKEPKQATLKPVIVKVEPQTLEEAFAVFKGRLMRRIVTRQTLAQFENETVYLAPTGERVRFADRIYRTSHLLHWLQTGEWILRISKAKRDPRYKAQVRNGDQVIHLGYFATKHERDAAVLTYKLTKGKPL